MKIYNLNKDEFSNFTYFISKNNYFIYNNAYQHKVSKKGEIVNLLAINFGQNSDTNFRIFIEEYIEVNKTNIFAKDNYKRTISNLLNWKDINNIELIVDDDGLPLNIKYLTHDNIAIIEIRLNELGLLVSFKEIKKKIPLIRRLMNWRLKIK